MLKNYLMSSLRNLRKTKTFSFVNIFGLSIGMAVCLLILHFVRFEKSYDRFIPDYNRIYRVRYERGGENGHEVRFASCTPPAGPMIREKIPEIEILGRTLKSIMAVAHENITYTEDRIFYAEPELFEILPFQLIKGQPFSVLKDPNKAFISERMAQKYFGDDNPLGNFLVINQEENYEVVGIYQDAPANSHLKMDFVLPWQNLADKMGPDYTENWGHTGTYTYIRTTPNASLTGIENKLANMVETEFGEVLREYKMYINLKLQPVADIHLNSRFMQEYEPGGNGTAVYFLTIIAIFIMIIAWTNYVNLSTARSLTRAREVGLRKVVGATRSQLALQFFIELVIINLFAAALAVLIVKLALSFFLNITGIPTSYSLWSANWFWFTLAIMIVAGVLLSGTYPVLVLTAFRPVTVLKGKIGSPRSHGFGLRKALVVFQFTIALMLISGTLAISGQLDFMQNQDLGFDKEQVLVIKSPIKKGDDFVSKSDVFKETLQQSPLISKVCHVTEVPGKQIYWDAGGIFRVGGDDTDSRNYQIVGVDYDFVDLFNLDFVAGRNFSREFETDKLGLILNETAVKWIGFESPEKAVGKEISYWGEIYRVIGVLKDFHQQSPKEAFEPHIYRFMPQGRGRLGNFAIKLQTNDIHHTIALIKTNFDQLFPGNPFDYYFLDDYYNQQYKNDVLIGKIFKRFTGLALFIMALGIFGLANFNASQRKREISIRKVLGASVNQILILLSIDFLVLIGVSVILAGPGLYFGLNYYLNTFAGRMPLNPGLFLLPVGIVVVLTLSTIITQTIKTALANPANVLRDE